MVPYCGQRDHAPWWKVRSGGMSLEQQDLVAGTRIRGLVAAGDVTVVAVEPHGDAILNVVYRTDDGQIGDRLVTVAESPRDSWRLSCALSTIR